MRAAAKPLCRTDPVLRLKKNKQQQGIEDVQQQV
jgi:hypothetical protein